MMVDAGWLESKCVVVTGGGRGIGEAIAREVAAHGAAVVVNDVDADPAERVSQDICDAGGRAVACVADVSTWDGAARPIATALETFGRLDGLVNNAGTFAMCLPQDQDPVEFKRLIDLNVLGVAYCGLHAIRHMVGVGGGSIVNVTSSSASGEPGRSAYGASKGAVNSITYGWASDLGGYGIRVNGLAPIGTTRLYELRLDFEKVVGADRDKVLAERYVDPSYNAGTVVYLLSDRSAHVSGQIVHVQRGNRIGLMSHPGLIDPLVRSESGCAEDVQKAFDIDFADRIQPLGLTMEDGRPVGTA
jgi:NAD(P)-dependent dehydrogenase (short-subunit alcohol dehydrogenase family)